MNKKSLLSIAAITSASMLLSACGTVAPGMYMPQSDPSTSGGPYPEDIVKSLRIRPINSQLLEQLRTPAVQTAIAPAEPWVYRIGSQDVLRITVLGHRDLSAAITIDSTQGEQQLARQIQGRVVDDQGFVFVPLAGNIKAAGLTIGELRERIKKALTEYIKDPQVELDVSSFRSQWVLMSGAVGTKGKMAITDVPMRLSDALAQAGATGADAGLEDVIVTRGNERITIDMYRVLYEGDQTKNMLLKHGDLVTVPSRLARKIFVAGEIGGVDNGITRSLVMRLGRMSLTEAIMDRGGPNMLSAKLREVYVIRDRGDGIPEIFQIDAQSPTALVLADAFMLKPRDIVYINPTEIAQVGRTLAQFFPTLNGANLIQSTNRNF